MAAFGALFSTKPPEEKSQISHTDSPDAAAGGEVSPREAVEEKKPSVSEPPRPAPPSRMPCRTRGLSSDAGSSVSSPSPRTPLRPEADKSHRSSKKSAQSRYRAPVTPVPEEKQAKEDQADVSSPFNFSSWWSSSDAPKDGKRQAKAREGLLLNDFCCFRKDDPVSRKSFEPIDEEKPETFDKDVTMLELHSVLRRHGVNDMLSGTQNQALVNDMLKWQARTAERSRRSSTECHEASRTPRE